MARPATGQVIFDERRVSPVFALRFRAYGQRQYVTLGTVAEGWTRERAETELQNLLADARRGIWRPPDRQPTPVGPADPTFHEFASDWFEANQCAWRANTRLDYGWQLTNHLLPFFKDRRLSQITIAEVDRYRAAKLREAARLAEMLSDWQRRLDRETEPRKRRELRRQRPPKPLSAVSINKTITRLAQILEVAVEYGLIDRNPAKGKRRRVKPARSAPVWLDRAGHIRALVDAAGELDRGARKDRQHVARRAMVATLVYAGLRISEMLELRWRHVDLSGGGAHGYGRLHARGRQVEESPGPGRVAKTDAGVRNVDVLPVLHGILGALPRRRPDDLVFATAEGQLQNPSNVRNRVLAPAVELCNKRLEQQAEVPLPERLSPHKLRHTFASVLVALGCDPGYVMDQLGHTDPAFTLRVYRHGMRSDQASRDALRELVGAVDWAAMGSKVVPVQFTISSRERRA
jgi:integrase